MMYDVVLTERVDNVPNGEIPPTWHDANDKTDDDDDDRPYRI